MMSKARERTNRRVSRGRVGARATVVGVLIVFATIAFAASRNVMALQEPASAGKGKKYVATRDITVDKETGALRKPTAAETEELVASLTTMLKPPAEGLTPIALPNGTTAMNVKGRFAPVMLARPNPDGTTDLRCVTTFEEALDFLGLVEDPSQQ